MRRIERLECSVVEISALKGNGIKLLTGEIIRAAENGKAVIPAHIFTGSVEHAIAHIEEAVLNDLPEQQRRWYAVKLFERDEKVRERLGIDEKLLPRIENDISSCEMEYDDDAESIITNARYAYITSLTGKCLKKVQKKDNLTTSDKIDRIVTNRWAALPIFAMIMFIVYYISVSTVGTWVTDWMNDGVFGDGWSFFGISIPGIPVLLERFLSFIGCTDWLQGLLLDGILAGVGAVLGFVPQMFVLFAFLAFLEGCGYMARVAFIMDRIFRKFGLSGKSFIPMLIGTGCGVPGVMASRTIENERDRRMTIMTTTFIPCGAKLPIIALIAGAIFHEAAWVAPAAYFLGVAAIIVSGIILKKTKMFAGDPSPFVMELPAYHLPSGGSVLRSMWERGWSFIRKAGAIILLSTVIIWFTSFFGFADGQFTMLDQSQMDQRILAYIGKAICWIFILLGWGSWQSAVAAITGLVAKENVVGTFGILYGFAEVSENGSEIWSNLASTFTPAAALSFLAFNLLCAPCFAAMGAIRREMNNRRWFVFAIGYQTAFAYIISLIIYWVANLIAG